MRNRGGRNRFRPPDHGIAPIFANTRSLMIKIEYDIHSDSLYEVSESKFGSGAIWQLILGTDRHQGHSKGENFPPLRSNHRYSTRWRTAPTLFMRSSSAALVVGVSHTQTPVECSAGPVPDLPDYGFAWVPKENQRNPRCQSIGLTSRKYVET